MVTPLCKMNSLGLHCLLLRQLCGTQNTAKAQLSMHGTRAPHALIREAYMADRKHVGGCMAIIQFQGNKHTMAVTLSMVPFFKASDTRTSAADLASWSVKRLPEGLGRELVSTFCTKKPPSSVIEERSFRDAEAGTLCRHNQHVLNTSEWQNNSMCI